VTESSTNVISMMRRRAFKASSKTGLLVSKNAAVVSAVNAISGTYSKD